MAIFFTKFDENYSLYERYYIYSAESEYWNIYLLFSQLK
jgi:hypothetical protein